MRRKLLLLGLTWLMLAFNSLAQTTHIKGLTLIMEFADKPFQESEDSVALMMNQPNFSGWGNQGSVRDFFYTQSAGKILITSEVIKVTLPHPRNYYYVDKLGNDVIDAVAEINKKYPAGFQNLTLKPDNSLKHFNILTKAGGGAWAFGAQASNLTIKNNGQDVFVNAGNITNYDQYDKPEHNTVCHEMGHNVMEWPDHYQTGWSNLGNYCVMASAGNRIAPQMINPALRLQHGWIDNVIEIGNLPYDQTYTAISNSYTTIYKYTNPNNPKEYLLLHPQVYGKYYQENLHYNVVTDQGLAIYYVDETEAMDKTEGDLDYFVKLLQADNIDEMHDEDLRFAPNREDVRGDYNDLYDNVRNSFPAGTPFRWKDGGEFGLLLGDISAPGATMSFTVYTRFQTHLATSDNKGTISPKGVLTGNTSITYTFTPKTGYELDQVRVNGVVTTVSGNTLTVGSGNKTIHATYRRKNTQTPLPSPWQTADIGSTTPSGFAAYESGKFLLESNSGDIWGNYDSFRFVYRQVTGNTTIIANISELNKTNHWSKAGIMIRESLSPNAAFSMLMKTPRNYYRVQQRTATGAYASDNPNDIKDLHYYALYSWLKVERSGNLITSYVSRDQLTWVKLGEQTITMGATVYVGLAVSGQNEPTATVAQFENVMVTSVNASPTVAITAPTNNATFFAPATVNITANANDADGTIAKVEFFLGSTLVATDYTAPYTYTRTNLGVGAYSITARATDNLGAIANTAILITVSATPSGPIVAGAACGTNNTTVLFEVSSANRNNATGYNWWYNGSAQSITPVQGTAYRANLATGNYFTSGQVCVGINYSTSPWYSSYCVNFNKCTSAREGEEMVEFEEKTAGFPNPFIDQTVLKLPSTSTLAEIQVFDASGVMVISDTAIGSYTFGTALKPGIYFVKVSYEEKTETLKLVKE